MCWFCVIYLLGKYGAISYSIIFFSYFINQYSCLCYNWVVRMIRFIYFYRSVWINEFVSKVKLGNIVEGDSKAPFSIGVGEGATPFPALSHFTLNPYLIMLSVKQGGIKYHFLCLWYDTTRDWTQVSRTSGEHSNHYANVL